MSYMSCQSWQVCSETPPGSGPVRFCEVGAEVAANSSEHKQTLQTHDFMQEKWMLMDFKHLKPRGMVKRTAKKEAHDQTHCQAGTYLLCRLWEVCLLCLLARSIHNLSVALLVQLSTGGISSPSPQLALHVQAECLQLDALMHYKNRRKKWMLMIKWILFQISSN